MSPVLFCVYLDSLFGDLRAAGIGCHVGGYFLGAFGYADDVTLLAPTRQGLQLMLNICEKYALDRSMLFSILFSNTRSADQIKSVSVNGDELPWIDSAKHLGNYLSSKIRYAEERGTVSTKYNNSLVHIIQIL